MNCLEKASSQRFSSVSAKRKQLCGAESDLETILVPPHISTLLGDFANYIGVALRFVYTYGIGEVATLVVWARLASISGFSVASACLPSCLIGFFASVVGLVSGGVVFFLVMFGPAYVRNDFIGTPWLTMIPALIIAPVAGVSAAVWICIRGTKMFVQVDSRLTQPLQ